jgi:hypothetical protein
MSNGNVKTVLSHYDAWGRGHFAFGADLIVPEVEMLFTNPIDPSTYRGRSLRDGTVVRMLLTYDRQEVLEAAGLSE